MSYFYYYKKFEGQGAKVLISGGMRAHHDAQASRDTLPLRQHLDLRRKSTGVMETVCVTEEPGTGVHNLTVILSGQSQAVRQIRAHRDARGLNRMAYFRSPLGC